MVVMIVIAMRAAIVACMHAHPQDRNNKVLFLEPEENCMFLKAEDIHDSDEEFADIAVCT